MSEDLHLAVPPDLLRLLRAATDAGDYTSVDAALADAVAIWARRREDAAEDLAWARARIKASLADPDPDLSEDEVDARLRMMFARAEQGADEAA